MLQDITHTHKHTQTVQKIVIQAVKHGIFLCHMASYKYNFLQETVLEQ